MTALDGERRLPIAAICFGVLGVVGLIMLFLPWYSSDDRGSVSGVGYASGTVTLLAMLAALGTFVAAALLPSFRFRSWLLLISTVTLLVAMSSVAFSLLAFAFDYAFDGSFDEEAMNPTLTRTPFALLVGLIVALPLQVMGSNEIDPQGPGWRRPAADDELVIDLRDGAASHSETTKAAT